MTLDQIKALSNDELRVKVAEACGWKNLRYGNFNDLWADNPDGTQWHDQRITIPDYLNDLNAMHEAEKVLKFSNRQSYLYRLQVVMSATLTGCIVAPRNLAFATARQRAEALVLTLFDIKPLSPQTRP